MRKPKTILFLKIIVFTTFLMSAGSVFALEAKYPWIPMVGTITEESGLGDYVGYFFGLGMYIAGILAVISFAIGAIQMIMAGSSPEMEKDGKDRMKGAILGLVLTLSAFVILQTINPKFVTPTLTPLPGVAGIFYTKGDLDDLKTAPMAESNIPASETIKKGYNQIYYKCTEGGEKIAPTLFIWKFPQSNLKGNDENYSGVTVVRKRCNDAPESIAGAGSFKMDYETPGIYYFIEEGCAGYMSTVNTTTQDKISEEPFTAKIKSVKIVNDPKKYKYYGAIFHNKPTASDASDCTLPVLEYEDGITCLNLSEFSYPGFGTYSVEIFNHGKDLASSSGDGVWFYGNVNGWDSGNKSGVSSVSAEEIGNFFMQNADSLRFDYTGVNTKLGKTCKDTEDNPACKQPGADLNNCCICAFPSDWSRETKDTSEEYGCGGSIRFGGNGYLVTLYTNYEDKNKNKRLFCQSFKKDAPNLSTGGSFLPPGNDELGRINIIPIH